MRGVKLYGPTSNLGYGISDSDVRQALKLEPDVIFQQGTSTDPGPGYLGSNTSYSDRAAVKRDLEAILPLAIREGIPFIFSAGGAGSNEQLAEALRIVGEISMENGLHFRAAVIKSEISPDFVKRKITSGEKIRRLVEHPVLEKQLSRRETDATTRLVGQMSYEPIINALDQDVQVVITGRACDIALPMALPLKLGYDKGLTAQVGKIVECGGAACERESMPAGASTGIFAIIGRNHALIKSLNKKMRCSVASVVSRGVLYERRDATIPEEMPNGYLDVSVANYEQVDGNTVKVYGGKFVQREGYLLKIEGVRKAGYRTICIAGVRDNFLIEKIRDGSFLAQVSARVEERLRGIPGIRYKFNFRVYGENGVLGRLEPRGSMPPHEMCIIIDAVARTPELSKTICMICRQQVLHHPYPGRRTTAGNVAFPFSPSDVFVGEVYEFNVFHLMPMTPTEVDEVFRPEILSFPAEGGISHG